MHLDHELREHEARGALLYVQALHTEEVLETPRELARLSPSFRDELS